MILSEFPGLFLKNTVQNELLGLEYEYRITTILRLDHICTIGVVFEHDTYAILILVVVVYYGKHNWETEWIEHNWETEWIWVQHNHKMSYC